jgi:hypothetical protein
MYIESIEEARIYNFYGDVEPIEEGVVDVLKGFVDKLRKAILALIDKIDGMLDNAKDGKLKTKLKDLLAKAKSLLNKTNSITSEEEALHIKMETEGIYEAFGLIGEHSRLTNNIILGKYDRNKVQEEIDRIEQKYGKSSFISYHPIRKEPPYTKKDLTDLEIESAAGACSKDFYLYMAEVSEYVHNNKK